MGKLARGRRRRKKLGPPNQEAALSRCFKYLSAAYFLRLAFFLAVFFLAVFFLATFFLAAFFLVAFFLAAFFLVAFLATFFLAAFFLAAFFFAFFLATGRPPLIDRGELFPWQCCQYKVQLTIRNKP